MSRFCFLLALGLLFVRPSESAASIQWEWTSESLDVIGTITLDETAESFLPGAWYQGRKTIDFHGRNNVPIGFQHFYIWLGPDPASPVGARIEAMGGEDSWNETHLFTTSIWFGLKPPVFGDPPAPQIQAFLDAYPEAGTPGNYQDVRASDGVLRAIAPVPEPATLAVWSLLGLMFGGVYWKRRAH